MTEFRHAIHGPTGTVAIYTRRSSGTADTYYLHRDHLGSPELVTNAAGTQIVKLSFGAFGERRGSSWSGSPTTADWTAIGNTSRDGFTGHEHLDNVGLVHMNGRVYDPKIGRFLSKDPIVHAGLSQSPNSYSYVWNNPLRFVDPCGWDPLPTFPELEVWGWRPQWQLDLVARLRDEVRSGIVPTSRGGGGVGGGVAPSNAEPAAEGAGEDPAMDQGDTSRQECLEKCRTRLEPAVQGAAGVAGGGVAGLVLGGPKAGVAGAAIGGVVGALSGAGAPGAVTVPYAGAAGATADMIVGGGGGMSNPFSRGGWVASLIGTAASRTPADTRTQVTIGAAAGAYVDGIAAARWSGGYPTPYSSVSGLAAARTAAAMLLAGRAAGWAYGRVDSAAQSYCEGHCGP